ncbi:TPA: hypothetical protein ACH3X2_013369 [Trebouxia sp. C0005]
MSTLRQMMEGFFWFLDCRELSILRQMMEVPNEPGSRMNEPGELSTLRQMMEVPNEPGLSPNNGLENALLSDQSMASNPRKGQAKRSGAKTTSHDGKAGHVMTHVCHCVLQED